MHPDPVAENVQSSLLINIPVLDTAKKKMVFTVFLASCGHATLNVALMLATS
jgi:hypothetical protein